MFHVDNFLFFGRLPNGDVRILKFKHRPADYPDAERIYSPTDVEFDTTVPVGSWPSVVAGVSKHGEGDGRFYTAQAFHMNPKPPTPKKEEEGAVFGSQF